MKGAYEITPFLIKHYERRVFLFSIVIAIANGTFYNTRVKAASAGWHRRRTAHFLSFFYIIGATRIMSTVSIELV